MTTFKVIKAAAGSGKTFTLVLNYLSISLCSEPFDSSKFRQILAITFTNKAATEMKERVLKMLFELANPEKRETMSESMLQMLIAESGLSENELTRRAAASLNRCLQAYDQIAISTIDSFVHQLVRQFAHDLDLPQPFEIEMDTQTALAETVSKLLGEVGKEEYKNLSKLVLDFVLERVENEGNWQVTTELESFFKILANEETPAYLSELELLSPEHIMQISSAIQPTITTFENKIHAEFCKLHYLLETAAFEKAVLKPFKTFIEKYTDKAKLKGELIKKLPDNIFQKSFLKAPDNEVKLVIDTFLELFSTQEAKDYKTAFTVKNNLHFIGLLHYGQKFLESHLRKDRKVLISELNQAIGEVVKGELTPYIYERLSERYKYFMIDEFQDTSQQQWQNLLPLLVDALASKGSVLCVGDGKQAIYRFRGGDVRLFQNLPKPIQESSPTNALFYQSLATNYSFQNLDTNYRSSATIVEFNNKLFGILTKSDLFPSTYKNVYHSHAQNASKQMSGFVAVHLFEKEAKTEKMDVDLDDENQSEINIIESCLLDTIRDLIGDPKGLNGRFKPHQVALLFRRNIDIERTALLLESVGYQFVSPESLRLNRHPAVQLLVFWLQLVQNIKNESARFGLLQILVQMELLAGDTLIETYKSKSEIAFFDLLVKIGIIPPQQMQNASILEKAHAFVKCLPQKFQNSPYILAMLGSIYEGSTKRNMGLADFLTFWEEKGPQASVPSSKTENALQLLTIHKSKGLEFPVVIIPNCIDLLTTQKTNGTRKWVAIPKPKNTEWQIDAANIAINPMLENTHFEQHWVEEKEAVFLDNVNLLYVAFTRAENELHVLLKSEKPKKFDGNTSEKQYFSEYLQLGMPEIGKSFETISDVHKICTFGEPVTNAKKGIKHTQNNLPDLHLKLWSEGIALADAGLAKQKAEMAYGQIVHQLVAEVNSLSTLNLAIAKRLFSGVISQSQADELQNALTSIWLHPELADALSGKFPIYSERNLSTGNGDLVRPDKLIELPEKWVVLEFKTGNPEPNHAIQANQYANLLSQSSQKKVSAYLVYLKNNHITVTAV